MILKKYEDYSFKVDELFNLLVKEISNALPHARIEHIGSSSIPGSISKGDLDVFVGVDQSDFEKSLTIIKELDFYEKVGTFRSHELCMLVTEKFSYDVAVQLVSNNSEFEDFIKFRDILRSNKKLLDEYNRIKLDAQDLDENEYRSKKNIFIERVLKT